MTIDKLPSGSYRIREMKKGKQYTVTVKEKPSKRDAIELINAKMGIDTTKANKTFFECSMEYIDVKCNVLSPSTVRMYRQLTKSDAFPEWFKQKDISAITQEDIQKVINLLSVERAPKTVRNYHGFISAVFALFRPSMQICTTLPQKAKNNAYIPTDKDVMAILDYAKGSEYEIALKLAIMGLRRSEICALTVSDLKGNLLTINKAKVLGDNNEWVIKTTKTTSSTRQIIIPSDLADLIRKKGYIYNGFPNSIHDYLVDTQKKLNIPRFSLHKLRHYFASSAHAMGIPDAYIMSAGGWQTDTTLKAVYRHALSDEDIKAQAMIADKMSKLY